MDKTQRKQFKIKYIAPLIFVLIIIMSVFSVIFRTVNTANALSNTEQEVGRADWTQNQITTGKFGQLPFVTSINLKLTRKAKGGETGTGVYRIDFHFTVGTYQINQINSQYFKLEILENGVWNKKWDSSGKFFAGDYYDRSANDITLSDTKDFKIRFYYYVDSGFGRHADLTTDIKTISAYDNINPTISSNVNDNGTTKHSFIVTAKDTKLSGKNNDDVKLYVKKPVGGFIKLSSRTYEQKNTDIGGVYQFYSQDGSDNVSKYYTINYETPTPSGTLTGVTNEGITKEDVSFSWDTRKIDWSATLDNVPYNSGELISKEDEHTIILKDNEMFNINNSKTYTFRIDKTAPILGFKGVTNGGFTNGIVSALWAKSEVENDTISCFYSRSLTGNFPTIANTECISGVEFTIEGNYLMSIIDTAGNKASYTFSIDKTAPIMTFEGLNEFNFSNMKVTPKWSLMVGGVGSQKMNINDALTVTYDVLTDDKFPTVATKEFTSAFDKEEGNYLIKITDKAGNYSTYQFTIDITAPTLKLSGLVDGLNYNASVKGFSASWINTIGGIGSPCVNLNDFLNSTYAFSANNTFPMVTSTEYTKNNILSDEGNYLLRISDKAGNKTDYRITVDCTAPSTSNIGEYINTKFDYNATDLHGVKIKYTFNDGVVETNDTGVVSIPCIADNYGTWTFYAIDDLGNKSLTSTVKLYYRDDFGNLENIKNGYKVTSWYIVTLPNKIFTDVAGKYSFTTRAAALNFAISKEWQYRVVVLSGNRWSYVNITNESVTQIYDKREELDFAVSKYASEYISERNTLQLGYNNYPNPTDENGNVREDALTAQSIKYPNFLSSYANLPLYLIQHNFIFTNSGLRIIGNTQKVTIKYVANDYATVTGQSTDILYDVKLETLLNNAGTYKQGYYLVTESDRCGNVQKYIVYLDTDTPTLNGNVTLGDGTQHEVAFNNDYVVKNANIMLYVSMELQSFFDNIDDYTVICISGRNMNDVCFINGDVLPTLSFEKGYYGKYIINVYDRSMNYISFTVRIAGENTEVKHTSLSSDVKCTFSINYDSQNNGITEIHLFKVSYLGEFAELTHDSDGTTVSAATLSYVIRVGGKYVIRVKDIFGRLFETEPMFYIKGLPVGTMRGVNDGGITKRDVTLEYSNAYGLWLFELNGKDWVRSDNVMITVPKENTLVSSITASEQTSKIYKFFLFVKDDLNLFVEYRFEIDCIAPVVEISAENGETIPQNGVTRYNFGLNWEEANVKAKFYSKSDPLGSFNEITYVKNSIITKAGEYVFTITDKVGNVTTFSVTLDNVVSYTIDGNYNILDDGSYISKTSITLTITERTLLFSCVSSNGLTIQNGEKLTIDGTYTFNVTDAFGNKLSIIAIIDNLPPEPIIKTNSLKDIPINSSTNENFKISCDENGVVITFKSDSSQYTLYNGEELSEEGVYSFKMIDRMNNIITFTVTIDRTVDYIIKGNYKELEKNLFISKTNFTIIVNEAYSSFVVSSTNGTTFLPSEKITNEGEYTVNIVDTVGNTAVFTLILDMTAPTPIILNRDGSIITQGKTKQPFTVKNSENNGTLKMSRTTGNGKIYLGEELTEEGIYYFTISDFIGNEATFTVEIDTVLNYVIGGVYKKTAENTYISKTGLSITIKEDYSVFNVANDDGVTFTPSELVTKEGTYIVTVTDIAGNNLILTFIIDKTAPIYKICTESGKTISPNSIINESFNVICFEKQSNITYSTNGINYVEYNGSNCTAERVYYFTISDFIGNEATFTVKIDLDIDYAIKGQYILVGNVYASKSELVVDLKEEYTKFEITSNNGVTFVPGELIKKDGIYDVIIEDLAGNIACFRIVIDTTAPTPTVINSDGVSIALNGVSKSPFTVDANEDNANITYSTNGSKYVEYDGSVLKDERIYYFIVSDFVGNETKFTITYDMSVLYSVKGEYALDGDRTYVSRYGLAINVNEEYTSFKVISNNEVSFGAGERVTKEGIYEVTIIDKVGNIVVVKLIIDQTAPIITANIDNTGITSDSVTVHIEGASKATYKLNAEDAVVVGNDMTFVLGGEYQIYAIDVAGNETTFKFTIDNGVSVAVTPALIDGQIVSTSVTFKFDEPVKTTLIKDGTEIKYTSTITKSGRYTLTAVDNQGNIYKISWIIIASTASTYNIDIPKGYSVIGTKDGQNIEINGDTLDLSKDGSYSFLFSNENNEYVLKIIVDTVAPTVKITQEKNKVTFSKADKDDVTYTLYLDDKIINCQPNSALTKKGKYRLIVTDSLGNSNEYDFTLDYINTFGIIVISLSIVVLIILVIGIVVYRFKQKIK